MRLRKQGSGKPKAAKKTAELLKGATPGELSPRGIRHHASDLGEETDDVNSFFPDRAGPH